MLDISEIVFCISMEPIVTKQAWKGILLGWQDTLHYTIHTLLSPTTHFLKQLTRLETDVLSVGVLVLKVTFLNVNSIFKLLLQEDSLTFL